MSPKEIERKIKRIVESKRPDRKEKLEQFRLHLIATVNSVPDLKLAASKIREVVETL